MGLLKTQLRFVGIVFGASLLLFPTSSIWAQIPTTATSPSALSSSSTEASSVKEAPAVLSFLEWKSMRVHEAQKKLEQTSKGTELKGDEQKLNFNVDVALQLTIQDYFSMYLKNLTVEEFKEAAKKLVPEEATELLMAYRNSLEKDKKTPLKFSKSAKDASSQKTPEI